MAGDQSGNKSIYPKSQFQKNRILSIWSSIFFRIKTKQKLVKHINDFGILEMNDQCKMNENDLVGFNEGLHPLRLAADKQ